MSMSDCHTQSLCPVCFRLLDAEYEARGDTVHLCKVCPEHGPFSVPVGKRVPGTPNFEVWRATRRIPAPPRSTRNPGPWWGGYEGWVGGGGPGGVG